MTEKEQRHQNTRQRVREHLANNPEFAANLRDAIDAYDREQGNALCTRLLTAASSEQENDDD